MTGSPRPVSGGTDVDELGFFTAPPTDHTPVAQPLPLPRQDRQPLRLLLVLLVAATLVALGVRTGAWQQRPAALGGHVGPPAGHEERGHPLGVPAAVVIPSSSYSFLMVQKDGRRPVTWSPCRPIHYVVRPGGAPPHGDELIADSFARLSAVTGFRFVDDGTTQEVPRWDRPDYQPDRYGNRWAPVLITWATLPAAPGIGAQLAGEAAPHPVLTRSGDLSYVTGLVALEPNELNKATARYGESAARMIVMHELGHLMGLDHVDDASQIMSPRASPLVAEYQPGDRAGLNALATGPCQPDV